MADDFEEQSNEKIDWQVYWRLLQRRRWWLLLPMFLGWAVVWGGSWLLPATYRSGTLILVEQQKVPEQYVVPNVANDLQDRLQSMTQQILSRTRLLRIMDQFHLYGEERQRLGPDELVDRMRKDIQIDLVQAPGHENDLTAFKIYYSSHNPRLAQQVTNELTTLFINENLAARAQQSQITTDFLSNQLNDAGNSLAVQEQRVREFKSRYLGELPGQMQSNVQILSGMQARLQAELDELNQAKQRNLYLETLLSQYQSLRSVGDSKDATPDLPATLDAELTRMRAQLAHLRARDTELHPDVRKLKQQIAETEALKNKIEADVAKNPPKPGNPTARPANYGDLKHMSPMMEVESQLKANQLEIKNRQQEMKNLEEQIAAYQTRLNETPVREQQLADLTRNYEQSKANYDSLLAKKNQSELATNLEKRQQGEQFRILDPPNLPLKPYWPNRVILSWAGLAFGMVLGSVATAGAELADDRIRSEEDLKAIVTAPVLVDMPSLPTAQEQRVARRYLWLQWSTAVLIFFVTAAGFFLSYYWG